MRGRAGERDPEVGAGAEGGHGHSLWLERPFWEVRFDPRLLGWSLRFGNLRFGNLRLRPCP